MHRIAKSMTDLGGAAARTAAHSVIAPRDRRRLSQTRPDLIPQRRDDPALRAAYETYVETVSVAAHAVSYEIALYLDGLCERLEPRRVLDTGSGFSSYVLRRRTAGPSGHCASVDDDPEWLERTRNYLRQNDLSDDGLVTWEEFSSQPQQPFDLVFHDLAGGSLREQAMPLVGRLLAPGGVIVFDDAHHWGHYTAMRRTMSELGLVGFSLRSWLRDGYGRFPVVAFHPA